MYEKISYCSGIFFGGIHFCLCHNTSNHTRSVSSTATHNHEWIFLGALDEKGWLIGLRDHEAVVLGKRGNDPDENMVIRAFAEVLPPLKSEEEFIGFAKSVLVMEGAARHKVLSQQTRPVKIKLQSCVRSDTVMEDHNAVKRSSKSDPMILEAYSMVCKHPNGSTGIVVVYSHRFYAGQKDLEAGMKAQKIFNSLEFSNL